MKNMEQLRALFEDYLKQQRFEQEPQGLYAPINYILEMGGKRMRPLFLLMSAQLFTDELEPALPAALAVELFHNFSLMHDDIMDEAPLRRGRPAVHKAYNTNTAILSGDVMLVYAYHYLVGAAQHQLPEVLATFNQTGIGVCEGQQWDINFETQEQVLEADYLRMIEQKTAVLLQGGMKIGALIAAAQATDANYIGEFGRNIGIAFQLQDDWLDTFGDAQKVGKKVGGDILQNKKTLLVIKALDRASKAEAAILRTWLSKTVSPEQETEKVVAVRNIFKKLEVEQAVQEKMQAYHKNAMQALEAIQVPHARKSLLLNFANKLMQREF